MSLSILHEELIRMVINQVNESDPESLPALRLVSKTFDSLVTPLIYGTKTMGSKLLTAFMASQGVSQTPKHEQQVVQDVAKYTRHLVMDPALMTTPLTGVLNRFEKLCSLWWPYWNQDHDIRREAAVVAAVMTQATSLRVLHLWELSDNNITTLAQACTELEKLTIQSYDLPNMWSPQDEFRPLTMFTELENLSIFTKFYKISPFRNNEFASGQEASRSNVQNWVEILVAKKQGTPFKKIVVNGKTKDSAPMEEWREEGNDPHINALFVTLPITFTYEPTSSEMEVDGPIVLQEESR